MSVHYGHAWMPCGMGCCCLVFLCRALLLAGPRPLERGLDPLRQRQVLARHPRRRFTLHLRPQRRHGRVRVRGNVQHVPLGAGELGDVGREVGRGRGEEDGVVLLSARGCKWRGGPDAPDGEEQGSTSKWRRGRIGAITELHTTFLAAFLVRDPRPAGLRTLRTLCSAAKRRHTIAHNLTDSCVPLLPQLHSSFLCAHARRPHHRDTIRSSLPPPRSVHAYTIWALARTPTHSPTHLITRWRPILITAAPSRTRALCLPRAPPAHAQIARSPDQPPGAHSHQGPPPPPRSAP